MDTVMRPQVPLQERRTYSLSGWGHCLQEALGCQLTSGFAVVQRAALLKIGPPPTPRGREVWRPELPVPNGNPSEASFRIHMSLQRPAKVSTDRASRLPLSSAPSTGVT